MACVVVNIKHFFYFQHLHEIKTDLKCQIKSCMSKKYNSSFNMYFYLYKMYKPYLPSILLWLCS